MSTDTIVEAHQKLTNRWWEERASLFELVVSELVYREAAAGDSAADLRAQEREHPERLVSFPAKSPRQRRGTQAS